VEWWGDGAVEWWSDGVMEWWSAGMLVLVLIRELGTVGHFLPFRDIKLIFLPLLTFIDLY